MSDLRLVIFDVDGTLVDSQAEILAAMAHAHQAQGLDAPGREAVLGIVGLSLDVAFARLHPQAEDPLRVRLATSYRDAFAALRAEDGDRSPLYPGAREAVEVLAAQDHTLLAVATGKSKRGLDKMLEKHGLRGLFHSEQTADHHPSKPDPSMILAALSETGVQARRAVMVGDTTYDMDMARAAGCWKIGVPWGYHAREALQPDHMIDSFDALPGAVDALLGETA